jgi:hypothetical protein
VFNPAYKPVVEDLVLADSALPRRCMMQSFHTQAPGAELDSDTRKWLSNSAVEHCPRKSFQSLFESHVSLVHNFLSWEVVKPGLCRIANLPSLSIFRINRQPARPADYFSTENDRTQRTENERSRHHGKLESFREQGDGRGCAIR